MIRFFISYFFAVYFFGGVVPVYAIELDASCVVNILNRTVQVAADGGWSMSNVPSTMGQIRARATCVRNGQTISGQTDFFTVARNGVVRTGDFAFNVEDSPPVALMISSSSILQLNDAGSTSALSVIATFPNNDIRDVSLGSSGINYTSTNPAIAAVDDNGVVTAVASGTALITARLDGTVAIKQVMVITSGDSDGDMLADDLERANGLDPNDPIDALEDIDGDGLTNKDELLTYGTSIRDADSDADGINDGEEVTTGDDGFITNPLLVDTDGDGIRDALEIATNSDPTDSNSFNLADALNAISVFPNALSLTVNAIIGESSQKVSVNGSLIDGTTLDLTSTVRGTNYSSDDLTVCNFGAESGRIFGSADGTCTITVSNSGFVDTVSVVVSGFTPIALSFINIPGTALNVDVSGDFAFVAAGAAGLQIVDIANRAAPVIIASLDTVGSANDIKVISNTAYIADGTAGLQIIDVTDPLAPVLISTTDTPGVANDLVVRGNMVFIADTNGIQIIDISVPENTSVIQQIIVPGAVGIDISNDMTLLAVALGAAGVQLVDISDMSNPILSGILDTGTANDLVLNGDVAIVADGASSLTTVDVSNRASPTVFASTLRANGGLLNDVALSANFALGADIFFVNGVPIIDIADPANPTPRAILDFSSFRDDDSTGIAVDANYVYLTAIRNNSSRLYIGQYLEIDDSAGIPPTVLITALEQNTTVVEGSQIFVEAQASDDVAVAAVDFLVDEFAQFTDSSFPYQFNFRAPLGVANVVIGAEAFDLAGNRSTEDSVSVNIIPDPNTTVSGTVLDLTGSPAQNVMVTVQFAGSFSALTGSDGSFLIENVPTVLGDIRVLAELSVGADELIGRSILAEPVADGITNVGTIQLFDADLGDSPTNPGKSCLDILQRGAADDNRKYWIEVPSGVFEMHCDFTSDTGGWTRVGALDGTQAYCTTTDFIDMLQNPDASAGKIPDSDTQAIMTQTQDSPMQVMFFSRNDSRYLWHALEKIEDFDTSNKHISSAFYCSNWHCDNGSIDSSVCGNEGSGCPITAHGRAGFSKKVYIDSNFAAHIRGMHTNGNICGLPNYGRAAIWVYVR